MTREEAWALVGRGVATEGNEVELYGLAMELLAAGRVRSARRLLRRLAGWAAAVGFAEALLRLAQAERLAGRPDSALTCLAMIDKEALDGQDTTDLLSEKMSCLVAQGDSQGAAEVALRIQTTMKGCDILSPEYRARVASRCASVLFQAGCVRRAREELAHAIRISREENPKLVPFVLEIYYSGVSRRAGPDAVRWSRLAGRDESEGHP